MEMAIQDDKDRGFYTETFHSSPWIYQGDDADSVSIPPNPKTKTRAVSSKFVIMVKRKKFKHNAEAVLYTEPSK